MAQIFHKSLNPVGRLLVLGLPMIFGLTGVGLAAFFRSSYATGRGEEVPQPVAFSHKHHVGELGIHCSYCHTGVEISSFAGIPPTKTCMNCHQQIWQGADLLEPVRASYATKDQVNPANQKPIAWNKVYNVPDYAYFNHAIHIGKGVGCVSCHGQIDTQALVRQEHTLLMEWCISCHREPEKQIRPKSEIYSVTWSPSLGGKWNADDFFHDGLVQKDGKTVPNDLIGTDRPKSQSDLGKTLKEQYNIRDAVTMTNCSMCHR